MITAKFDPAAFFQRTEHIALHVPAAEVFGLLKRTMALPAAWGALVKRLSGHHEVIPAGGDLDGSGADDVLFVRVTPSELSFSQDGLQSKDGFACKADVRVRLRVIPERGELRSFSDAVVGSRRVIHVEKMTEHFAPVARLALASFAAQHDAADLTDGRVGGPLSEAIATEFNAACFSSGLVLDAAPTGRFESGSFQRVQHARQSATIRQAEHEAARQLDDALRKARHEHLDQLTTLLTRLREMAAASPDVKLPDLVRTFSERQRGDVYEALFASDEPTTRTRWIIVAAGEELLFFDPPSLASPARRLRVDGAAGPARSVQLANPPLPSGEGSGVRADPNDAPPVLLVGAATGLYLWPIDGSTPAHTLLVRAAPAVRGGFNAAVQVGERVIATHSELGIREWNLAAAQAPAEPRFESMTRGAKAVRDIEVLDGQLYCSIDDRVISWSADGGGDRPTRVFTGSAAVITAICPTGDGLYAGNSNGDVLHWLAGRDDEPQIVHRGARRAVESLWTLATHGVKRLIYTDTSHRIHARVLGDSFTCHYEAGGQTLRRVEVAPDVLVATTELRDRLVCFSPGDPTRPSASIPLASLTGRTVQDVCLV